MHFQLARCLSSILFILLFISGCASTSLHSPRENAEAILVIPKSINNSSHEGWARKFKIEISQSGKVVKTISVPTSSDNFILIDDLPSGQYQINKYMSYIASRKWRPMGEASRERWYEVPSIEFKLSLSHVTLLDYNFHVEQIKRGGFIQTQAFFSPLFRKERAKLISDMHNLNKSVWTVSEPSIELPTRSQVASAAAARELKQKEYVHTLANDPNFINEWSSWVSLDELENEIIRKKKADYYPIVIDGRYYEGKHRFRLVFRPYPKGEFNWVANWKMTREEYLELNFKHNAKGYERVWVQDYNGLTRNFVGNMDYYQAIWIRLGKD